MALTSSVFKIAATAFAAAACLLPLASAQLAGGPRGDRTLAGIGGGNHRAPIVLYTSEDFRGEALSFDRDERGLGRFNDRARSVRVNRGVWLLCDDVNFGGRCEYVDRDVRDLRQIGLHGRVSSIKLTPYPEGPGRQAITLFQHNDFRGPFLSFDEEVPSLGQYNFRDQVSSIRVSEGRWLICEDANFRGQCEIIRGDVRSLSDIGMNDRISSLRRARPGDRPRGGYGPRPGGNDGYGNGHPRPRGSGHGHGGGSFGNDRGFEGQDTVFFPRPTNRYGDPIRNGSGQATRFCRDMGFRSAEYKGRGSYLVDVLCEK